MQFHKYHGLGNDYIVIDPEDAGDSLAPEIVKTICHRNYGIGADGILFGPFATQRADFGVRIFNPDGSEAEKSGNGLRIFTRYLWDMGMVDDNPFTIETVGGVVQAKVHTETGLISVDMGTASFNAADIPVNGVQGEVLRQTMKIGDQELTYCAVTVGNPHCVIVCDEISKEMAVSLGSAIENDPKFPNRTNVQFMKAIDRSNIAIEIWERGAGYTLASGSSASASAAVARRLGLCGSSITVHMPGGTLDIIVKHDYSVRLTGPASKIAIGVIASELLNSTDSGPR
ncbi:MAG: diaminopimelate epimerase [Desulfococcus sp. 4484_241]|nr:MAG: diaminopimelate epimerase [Desulfococcus sp. 4484_241]